jgi:hypothetical protein
MAIQLTRINKIASDNISVQVFDTETEASYTTNYNPSTGPAVLKKKIEDLIWADKTKIASESAIESQIKSTIEAIDTGKIGD